MARWPTVPEPDPLHEGMMIGRSVRLSRPLGAGGMGSVWVADHLSLHTQVVVKFMARALADDPDFQARFAREAAAASQVKSPHVVQMLDHGVTDEGLPYIIMEYLEGRDLAHRLQEQRRLPPGEVATIVAQVAKALARAHERGIVHRDVKPENIFLCDVGGGEVFAKLLDFGVAKGTGQLTSKTQTGTVIGSPQYMSPEQMTASKALDHRSDLWSLAVVAYEAVTGTLPFDADTVAGLAVQVHNQEAPPPSRYVPSLSPAIDGWFRRALAKAPDQRFGSAKELADNFSRAADVQTDISVGAPVSGTMSMPPISSTRARMSHSATELAPPPPKRRRGWIVPAAVLLLLAVGGIFFVRRRDAKMPEERAPASASVVGTATSAPVVVTVASTVAAGVAPSSSSAPIVSPKALPPAKPLVASTTAPDVTVPVVPVPTTPPTSSVASVAPKGSNPDPFGEARK